MSGFEDLLEELLAPLGGVTIRRMFGGRGVFKDGLMFALASSRDVFYLKADEESAPAFVAEGCEQWTPEMKGRAMAMPYWQAPERLFDEPEEFADWAKAAYAAARRMEAAKARPTKAKAAAKPGAKGKSGKSR
jgi:DNA transformation protein and related proteins